MKKTSVKGARKSEQGSGAILPNSAPRKKYLWDRYESSEIVKCSRCGSFLNDGWKVSVNSRENPSEVYYRCHSCAGTVPRVELRVNPDLLEGALYKDGYYEPGAFCKPYDPKEEEFIHA